MNPADNSPLWIRGARVIDPSAKRDEAKGDIFALDGKFVDQLTWIKKMYDEGLFVLKSKDTGETANDAFVNGNCQITSSSIADHGTFGKQAKEGVNWTAAMLPMLEGFERHNSFVGGASLWTLKGKSPEEYKGAAAFYAFLATPEQATWWSTVTGYIPVVNSAFAPSTFSAITSATTISSRKVGRRYLISWLNATHRWRATASNTRKAFSGNCFDIFNASILLIHADEASIGSSPSFPAS